MVHTLTSLVFLYTQLSDVIKEEIPNVTSLNVFKYKPFQIDDSSLIKKNMHLKCMLNTHTHSKALVMDDDTKVAAFNNILKIDLAYSLAVHVKIVYIANISFFCLKK